MRVLVTGDREWGKGKASEEDREILYRILDDAVTYYGMSTLIEGCARGADRMAEEWAVDRGFDRDDKDHFPAEWDKYRPVSSSQKNPAGPIRNRQMLVEGKPDMVLAFHRSLNTSKGTADMVKIAREAGVPVFVFPAFDNG